MDIKEFILDLFAEDESLKHLDVTEGSNLYDLLVLPLKEILESKISKGIIDTSSSKLDLANYKTFSTEDFLRISRGQFLDVPIPNRTKGFIKLHFSSPVDVAIPKGSTVYAGSVEFSISRDVNFRKSDLEKSGILYVSPQVMIENENGVSVEANTIGSIDGSPEELIKVTHPAMVNGVKAMTAEEMFGFISNSINSRHFMSSGGTSNTIKTTFPAITEVVVVGPGDELMQRDILYNVAGLNNKIEEVSDFLGKVRGKISSNEASVYNSSIASALFVSQLSTELSSLEGRELSQQEYISVLKQNDGIISINTDNILEEHFEMGSETGGTIQNISGSILAGATSIALVSASGLSIGHIVKVVGFSSENVAQPPFIGVIRDITGENIELFSPIPRAIGGGSAISYVEVLEAEGYYLGDGWVRGETGLNLGMVMSDQSIMTIDGRLVMGSQLNDLGGNLVLETVMKMGLDQFIDALKAGIKINSLPMNSNINQEISNDNKSYNNGQQY